MELKNLLDFSTPLGGELAQMQTKFKKGDAFYKASRFNKGTTLRGSMLSTATNLYHVFRIYKEYERRLAVVSLGKDCYAVELDNADGSTQIVTSRLNKQGEYEFSACVIGTDGTATNYSLTTYKGTAILLCLMPIILKESEAESIWKNVSFQMLLGLDENSRDWKISTNLEDFGQFMEQFSDNIYRRFSIPDACEGFGITTNMVSSGAKKDNISLLSLAQVTNLKYEAIVLGTPKYFPIIKDNTPRVGKYALVDMNKYTEEQRQRIPVLPEWYVVPFEVEDVCRNVKMSTIFPSPIRTFAFIGDSGSGKTEMAKECASQLALPYDHYVCHENTELLDMLFQILPTGNKKVKTFTEIREELGLPDTDEIINDPEYAYEVMYGEQPKNSTDVDEALLLRELIQRICDRSHEMYANAKEFTFVKGGLLVAIEEGKFFEIQEIANVRRQGDLVGLNALLTTGDDAFITLPTGEVVTKDPNCVICFTSNRGYEGCGTINQSVLSRMAIVKKIDTPTTEVLVERVMKRLNFPKKHKDLLTLMATVVKDIEAYSKEHNITDGVCGYRELENWAMTTMINSMADGCEIDSTLIAECGVDTVLNKTSQIDEYIEEIRISCYDKQFGN